MSTTKEEVLSQVGIMGARTISDIMLRMGEPLPGEAEVKNILDEAVEKGEIDSYSREGMTYYLKK